MNSLALTDDDVDNFIKFFHTYLKEYGMCFLNGNYIVQDNKNYLYNFLTYNTPIQGCLDKKYEKSSQVDFHWTTTHIEFFNTKDKDIKFSNCISYKNIPSPTFKKYFKVERVFKDSLSYLCDEKTLSNKRDINNHQNKRIAIYYPFRFKNKNYLYLKFEGYGINSFHHLFRYISKNKSKRNETYNSRRTEKEYSEDSLKQDLEFYKKINDLKVLEKYNKRLRIGDEMFISKKLLLTILVEYLKDIKLS